MSMNFASSLGKLKVVAIICCLVLIFSILGCSYLSDINNSVLNKDEIINKVESLTDEDPDYEYLSSYIKKYGIGNINTYKINQAESKIRNNYYKELPERQQIAENTVSLFLEYFYDKIDLNDRNAVTDAVLECFLVSIGDPWAYYRTAEKYQDYSQSLEGGGEFVGIGVVMNSQTLEITTVYTGSGAADAGIKAKDILYGVEDKTSDDTPVDELLNLIKGEPDTTVKIVVKRNGELKEFNVMRKILTERTVNYEINEHGIGYIQITQFLSSTVTEFKEAADYCVNNNARAIVFDLRSNPGGLLSSVVSVIDYIVPDADSRRIGSYTMNGEEQVFYTGDKHSIDLPIVVICNEGTASAGELFTGAMRDYGKSGVLDTLIVGKNTYGKGVAQSSFYLYDGSALTFTIGYFNPPSNVNFNGVGVAPDIIVEEIEGIDEPLAIAQQKALEMAIVKESIAYIFSDAA